VDNPLSLGSQTVSLPQTQKLSTHWLANQLSTANSSLHWHNEYSKMCRMDSMENTPPNSPFIVATHGYRAGGTISNISSIPTCYCTHHQLFKFSSFKETAVLLILVFSFLHPCVRVSATYNNVMVNAVFLATVWLVGWLFLSCRCVCVY
jgi:hypothetical protein